MNCEQVAEMDTLFSEKEDENSRLKEELARLRRSSPSVHSGTSEGSRHSTKEDSSWHMLGVPSVSSRVHHRKAPPVDAFTGVDPEIRFEDWLPTLKKVVLLQLARHLKGRALREWNLLPKDQKSTYDRVVLALQGRG